MYSLLYVCCFRWMYAPIPFDVAPVFVRPMWSCVVLVKHLCQGNRKQVLPKMILSFSAVDCWLINNPSSQLDQIKVNIHCLNTDSSCYENKDVLSDQPNKYFSSRAAINCNRPTTSQYFIFQWIIFKNLISFALLWVDRVSSDCFTISIIVTKVQ